MTKFSWGSKDGWKDPVLIRQLPSFRIEENEDPLSKFYIKANLKKSNSLRSSSSATDPLNLFASTAEGASDNGPELGCALEYSPQIHDDNWHTFMKASDHFSTKDVLVVPQSCLFIIKEMLEDKILNREASYSKVQWLESLRHRSKDPVKKREADINAYVDLGIPGTSLLPFSHYLQSSLDKYWQEDQKVSAIKLTIQVALMLHEYDDPSFYHHKFYHLSEVIYQFGKATYSRLLGKSPGIRINFSFKDVVEAAQELTRNWFAKISAIRELLPRLYLETSLLKCYRLIPEGDYNDILERLSLSIRGVSDPLVNLYIRCFLLRVIQNLAITTSLRSQIGQLNYDEMTYLLNNTNQTLDVESLKKPIKWILEGTLCGLISDFDKDQIMLKHFQSLDIELNHSGVLLNNLIRSSSPSLVSEILLQTLIPTILECKDESFPQGNLIYSLGKSLINSPEVPFYQLHRLQILKSVWSVATTIKDVYLYLDVSIIWIEFLCINFKGSVKELNILFQDIVLHLKENSESFTGAQLKNIFIKVIKYEWFVYSFLSMAHFLPLFNFLDGDYKYQVSKRILERLFLGNGLSNEIKEFDSVANNVLLYLCQMLSDSISPFTVEDEIRQISLLVCSVCRFIDSSHKSVEKRLNFYTEMRRRFGFLDRVQYELIVCVNDLGVYTYKRVNGEHTHKTKGFVQACIAFSFITIPTLKDQISKVYAYTHTAQIALFNCCVGQADSCLRSALNLIPLMKEPSETRLINCINNLLSTLILLPDSGENGVSPLGIFRFALNRISAFPSWTSKGLLKVYLNALRVLSLTIWERYPYEIKGLDTNAQLYVGNDKFIATVNSELSSVVLNQCLDLAVDEPIHYEVLFELLSIILHYSDMSKDMVNLAYKLWKLTRESKEKWIIKSRQYILNDFNHSVLKNNYNYRVFHKNILKFENMSSH